MTRRRQRSERSDKEEEVMPEKRRASVYFDEYAEEEDEEEEEVDDEDLDDGFYVDSVEDIPDDNEFGERGRKSPLVDTRDEEEFDVEAMEKMVNERYSSKSALGYDEDFEEEFTELEQQAVLPSVRDPKLWLVKCLPGHERKIAASLMQKSLHKGSNSCILSAIALDHLKNYIYIEAYNEASVVQACKGMRNVFARNVTMVPLKEMSEVLSVERKEVPILRGDWVRLKRSSYKGKLAKVVDVDDVKQKITVKVIPKFSALSLSDNLEGAGYLYKTVALSSVSTGDVYPSIQEVENFREIGEADADMAILFKGKDKGCWMRGDAVVVVKGELKNLTGSIEYVEGDIVHIRPNEKIPLKTVAVHKRDLVKYFKPGSQVKVVSGIQEGATGMVVKVDQNKLVILSDASQDHITVFAEQVIESRETSESKSKEEINHKIQDRHISSSGSRRFPQPIALHNMHPGTRPSPPVGRGAGYARKRQDSVIGCKVKIVHGPYRGYCGCVNGINGQYVRVELEAQMKVITVERDHISDNLAVSNTSCSTPQHKKGSETPMHLRTPMDSMEGETPWRTPFCSSHPYTPILHGSRASTVEQWNPYSLTRSPSTFLPTP